MSETEETQRLPFLMYRSSLDNGREINVSIGHISRWPTSYLCRADDGKLYCLYDSGTVKLIGYKNGGQIVGRHGRLV